MSEQSVASCESNFASVPFKRVYAANRGARKSDDCKPRHANEKTLVARMMKVREEVMNKIIAERFLIKEEIGRGVFGTVYKGVDSESGNNSFLDNTCNNLLS